MFTRAHQHTRTPRIHNSGTTCTFWTLYSCRLPCSTASTLCTFRMVQAYTHTCIRALHISQTDGVCVCAFGLNETVTWQRYYAVSATNFVYFFSIDRHTILYRGSGNWRCWAPRCGQWKFKDSISARPRMIISSIGFIVLQRKLMIMICSTVPGLVGTTEVVFHSNTYDTCQGCDAIFAAMVRKI